MAQLLEALVQRVGLRHLEVAQVSGVVALLLRAVAWPPPQGRVLVVELVSKSVEEQPLD